MEINGRHRADATVALSSSDGGVAAGEEAEIGDGLSSADLIATSRSCLAGDGHIRKCHADRRKAGRKEQSGRSAENVAGLFHI